MARLNVSRMAKDGGESIGGFIAQAWGVRASTAMASSWHAQHAVALFVGLDAEVRVDDAAGRTVQARAVVVPADLVHTAACPGPTLGILYDPEVVPSMGRLGRVRGQPFALEGRHAARCAGALREARADLSENATLHELARVCAREAAPGGGGDGPGLDRRVARAVELLRGPDPVERQELLAHTRLSDAHLQALFVRDVGLPMRAFRLWRRLLRGLVAFSTQDATTAAHAVGFADLAHFSRSCRRLLGYTPTALRRGLPMLPPSPGSGVEG
jgi:AraC-like DNA-binding protein